MMREIWNERPRTKIVCKVFSSLGRGEKKEERTEGTENRNEVEPKGRKEHYARTMNVLYM